MLKDLILREFLDGFTSKKFLVVLGLCCLVIPLSVVIGQRSVAAMVESQQRAQAEYERSLEGRVPSDDVEVKVFRPRPALAGLAMGVDPAQPNVVTLSQQGTTYSGGQAQDNPLAALFGAIDVLFIIKFILSLAAIILSFDLICGEKENGTLKLILSNPVPRDSILVAKVIGAFGMLVIPLIMGMLVSLLILLVIGDPATAGTEPLLRIAGLLGVFVLYLGVFINLGALVSTSTSRSLTSITLLLVLWVALTAVVPPASGLIAEFVHPVESTGSLLLRKGLVERDLNRQRLEELSRYQGRDDYSELRKPIAEKYADQLQRLHARMDEDYDNRRSTQRRIASSLALVSPASALSFASTSLSETGIEHAQHFSQSVLTFRDQVNQEIFADSYRDLFLGAGGGQAYLSIVDLGTLPEFSYQPPSLGTSFAMILPQVGLLALFNIAFFIAAYARFRKYDVR